MNKKLIVVDLEATCWEPEAKEDKQMEIIEIGAAKLDKDLNVIDEFQSFVRPVLNPELSEYCKRLTTIKQEEIYKALCFTNVLNAFRKWIHRNPQEFIFSSWGRYDRYQLIEDCILHSQLFPFTNEYLNLKNEFAKLTGNKRCGVGKALSIMDIQRSGTAHRALDDVRSTVEIYKKAKEMEEK